LAATAKLLYATLWKMHSISALPSMLLFYSMKMLIAQAAAIMVIEEVMKIHTLEVASPQMSTENGYNFMLLN
jgi:hypothetical protein